MGGCTQTRAGATTTGAGTGIPKLMPKRTPAFAPVIPSAAKARIAIVFFIFTTNSTQQPNKTSLLQHYRFVSCARRVAAPSPAQFRNQE
jgi:hypothetical protein